MNKRKLNGEKLFDIFNYIVIIALSITTIYPFLYVFTISLSPAYVANTYGLKIFPTEITFEAFDKVFGNKYIWTGYFNTIVRVIVGTVLNVLFTVLGAYPLSKKHFPNRNLWLGIIVFTMFFNGGLIPSYMLVKGLGLLDSMWSMILPGIVGAYSIIIARNFFLTIPVELEESAKIDGANDVKILSSIIIPMSLPIIATVGLWAAVSHWNSWFDCLIYISNSRKMVLQVILQSIIVIGSSQYMEVQGMLVPDAHEKSRIAPETIKSATILVATIPILCTYPFVQKYFIKGVMMGSIKG